MNIEGSLYILFTAVTILLDIAVPVGGCTNLSINFCSPTNFATPYPNVFEKGSSQPGKIVRSNSSSPNINNIGKMVAKMPVFIAFGLLHTDFAKAVFMDICVDTTATIYIIFNIVDIVSGR